MSHVVNEIDQEWLVISTYAKGTYYNRSNSNDIDILREKLSKRYKSKYSIIFPSGMSAISSTLQCYVTEFIKNATKDGVINIFIGNELYSDTPKVCRQLQQQFSDLKIQIPIKIYELEVTDSASIISLIKEKHEDAVGNILFIETSSNPSGLMMDPKIYEQLREFATTFSLKIITDNTWLSSASYLPPLEISKGVDVAVTSLSKYYSAGTAIAGAVMTNCDMFNNILEQYRRTHGLHVSPYNARSIHNAITTLDDRIKHSSAITCQVVSSLYEAHPEIVVSHPSLPNHPSYSISKESLIKDADDIQYPSVFTFRVKSSSNFIMKTLNNSNVDFKTSFGGSMSRYDPYPTRQGEYMRCRFSVGYNDTSERILEEINNLIKLCNEPKRPIKNKISKRQVKPV